MEGHRGVVVYPGASSPAPHEQALQRELSKRLARLQGLEFLGNYDPDAQYGGRLYYFLNETMSDPEQVRRLGIREESDLFGGVVPKPFIATKSITHPLLHARASAPAGWSFAFGKRVRGAVLDGYSAFSLADARQAGRRLLARGPFRVKTACGNAGRGQWKVASEAALDAALERLEERAVARYGVVLEEQLENPLTYSIGQVRVGGRIGSYYGSQQLTTDNTGATVYGGSELVVTRGGFGAVRRLAPPDEVALAIAQAERYDDAANVSYPGFFASRRNYDVACGTASDGCRRCGVLEQSWRQGGASSAEVLALETLYQAHAPPVVRAASLELYGRNRRPPPQATVLFQGEDADAGFLSKSVIIQPYGRDYDAPEYPRRR